MKVSTLTEYRRVLGKSPFFSEKPISVRSEESYFSRFLRIKYFQTQKRTLTSSSTLSKGKTSKKTFNFSVLSDWFSFDFRIWAEKNKIASDSKNRDGQQLNVSLTMPKIIRNSEKPWFSKRTSEETILELRTHLNIRCITGWVQNDTAKQLNGSRTMFKN